MKQIIVEKNIPVNNNELAIFRRRNIGLIYQFYNLIPILNVAQYSKGMKKKYGL